MERRDKLLVKQPLWQSTFVPTPFVLVLAVHTECHHLPCRRTARVRIVRSVQETVSEAIVADHIGLVRHPRTAPLAPPPASAAKLVAKVFAFPDGSRRVAVPPQVKGTECPATSAADPAVVFHKLRTIRASIVAMGTYRPSREGPTMLGAIFLWN